MTTDATPNPKVLDLGALLAGVELPTDTVDVYMNAAIAYAIHKNRVAAKRATLLQEADKVTELDKEHAELVEAGLKTRLTFHLQAIPKGVRRDLMAKALEAFPSEPNVFGLRDSNPDRDYYHANLIWAAHIAKMVGPNGEEGVLADPDQIDAFRAKAPEAAVDAVENAIHELSEGSKSGFESLAQERSFL